MMKILIANCHAGIIYYSRNYFNQLQFPTSREDIFILWVDNLKSNDEGNIKEIE